MRARLPNSVRSIHQQASAAASWNTSSSVAATHHENGPARSTSSTSAKPSGIRWKS